MNIVRNFVSSILTKRLCRIRLDDIEQISLSLIEVRLLNPLCQCPIWFYLVLVFPAFSFHFNCLISSLYFVSGCPSFTVSGRRQCLCRCFTTQGVESSWSRSWSRFHGRSGRRSHCRRSSSTPSSVRYHRHQCRSFLRATALSTKRWITTLIMADIDLTRNVRFVSRPF